MYDDAIFHAGDSPAQFNEIYNNGELNFVNSTKSEIFLPYTYWGSSDSLAIIDKILDGRENQGLGIVNISPFLDKSHNPVVTSVEDFEPLIVEEFVLNGIYPNPFRDNLKVAFKIGRKMNLKIRIYNLIGQEITTYNYINYEPGDYELNWNGISESGSPLASGIYFVEFLIDNHRFTKRVLHIK